MKPGYKIIIVGLLVYGGLKIKTAMAVAPYKERAASFVGMLSQNRSFEAQTFLDSPLQKTVSIEKLHTLIHEYNLTHTKEISWAEWEERDDGGYALQGNLLFTDMRKLPVAFLLFPSDKNNTLIGHFKIGAEEMHSKEGNKSIF